MLRSPRKWMMSALTVGLLATTGTLGMADKDQAKAVDAHQVESAFGIPKTARPATVSDDGLLDQAMVKAREIAQWPISSLVETKRLMRRVHMESVHSANDIEQEAMMRLAGSAENIESVMAFLEKRQPDFKQFRK